MAWMVRETHARASKASGRSSTSWLDGIAEEGGWPAALEAGRSAVVVGVVGVGCVGTGDAVHGGGVRVWGASLAGTSPGGVGTLPVGTPPVQRWVAA